MGDGWDQLRSGDQGALLALYQHHYIGLINYGFKICGNKETANDCFIKVLLRLWDDRAHLPHVKNTRSYLMTCVRNEILQHLKTANRHQANINAYASETESVEQPYEEMIIALQSNVELQKKLLKAFQCLTEREKELLKMKFYDDLDYDEIAERCQITKRTAYNIIHGALKRMKKELHQDGVNVIELYPILIVFLSTLFQ
ncbi:sigma-70 family RNA polymerase sigma factor [Danxiaibacter flavus]|uniref:Sigma-70 family RNA polymerase sigma factor n=1 Tax=Danxiaibacter flavus TaxID=3049108 RepID=A0ABV3ZIF8_9BACT|nr:sigma-70 family RNA polymerase sigma factor [Chitinophagaceae bacterium DXS]